MAHQNGWALAGCVTKIALVGQGVVIVGGSFGAVGGFSNAPGDSFVVVGIYVVAVDGFFVAVGEYIVIDWRFAEIDLQDSSLSCRGG